MNKRKLFTTHGTYLGDVHDIGIGKDAPTTESELESLDQTVSSFGLFREGVLAHEFVEHA